tara:strand:- start:2476 stop:3738 length:1263 start_codon:yes stop_codon:yes gene_type:complete
MKIAILGSGGREHAITFLVSKSKKIKKIYCIPGNAGTSEVAENINIEINDFKKIYSFIIKKKIDLVVVGPEDPLVNGIVDYLEKLNVKVFGPNKIAAKLEGSKIFTKNICKNYNIPSAKFKIFINEEEARKFLKNARYPLVVKADNLAAGKGVYICKDKKESYIAVEEIFGGKFGDAKNILFEEFLQGEEMSFFIISDGSTVKNFGTAQDHKRVGEGDKGKNTGGMGAYSPSRLINENLENKIFNKIINPTLKALSDLGTKYKGFLYVGLIIIENEPYLIEYNVRMGDPECQTILPTLSSDIVDIFVACVEENLHETPIVWSDKKSVCVVLCAEGYPETYKKNIEIKNFEKVNLDEHNFLFHAGTKNLNDKVFAIGGRVLNFISLSDDFAKCRKNIHNNLEKLNWNKGFYRKDIGFKVID